MCYRRRHVDRLDEEVWVVLPSAEHLRSFMMVKEFDVDDVTTKIRRLKHFRDRKKCLTVHDVDITKIFGLVNWFVVKIDQMKRKHPEFNDLL